MLPFLHPRNVSTSIIMGRNGGHDLESNPEIDKTSLPSSVKECAENVMRAFDKRSPIDLVYALRDLFEEFDSMPHEEGNRTNYDEEYGE